MSSSRKEERLDGWKEGRNEGVEDRMVVVEGVDVYIGIQMHGKNKTQKIN